MQENAKLTHVTLNTGHTAVLPRVQREVAAKLREIGRRGGDLAPILPHMAGWSVDVKRSTGAALFSMSLMGVPVVDCMVCWMDDVAAGMWDYHERFYFRLSDTMMLDMAATEAPSRPVETPWCAVILMPSITKFPKTKEAVAAVRSVGELERIISWAIIDDATGGEVAP